MTLETAEARLWSALRAEILVSTIELHTHIYASERWVSDRFTSIKASDLGEI